MLWMCEFRYTYAQTIVYHIKGRLDNKQLALMV